LIASCDRRVRDRLLLVLLAGNIIYYSNPSATIHTATLSLPMQTFFLILEGSICQAKIRVLPAENDCQLGKPGLAQSDSEFQPCVLQLYCAGGKRV
jgi:hypothetical protein